MIRHLFNGGMTKAQVMEETGCSRQAFDAAVAATPQRGRPRTRKTAEEITRMQAQLDAIGAASARLASYGGRATREHLKTFANEVFEALTI